MADYRADEGREDRHGEMTGAITFNMILVFPPLVVWCVFIGPDWIGVRWTVITGLVLSVALTCLGIPVSRWLWSEFSAWVDRYDR
ncbi:MAG: hypothetical protein ACF8PN_14300 [Phycisphaerales bacterium]